MAWQLASPPLGEPVTAGLGVHFSRSIYARVLADAVVSLAGWSAFGLALSPAALRAHGHACSALRDPTSRLLYLTGAPAFQRTT
eukprot:3048449-Prymnesium_polylepis.1